MKIKIKIKEINKFMYYWQVMHLCERQLRDVDPNDILNNGLYRKCDIYKGGGGYDKFAQIYQNRNGILSGLNKQFVVQLKGCPLRCPYCYVTVDGVHKGKCSLIETEQLVKDFIDSELKVFHLMGGAPALYIDYWDLILRDIPEGSVFHSDLLLVEQEYKIETLEKLMSYNNALYAVSIKGSNGSEFQNNTGTIFNEDLFWDNFDKIVEVGLPFYLTFTGMSNDSVYYFNKLCNRRYGKQLCDHILRDSFSIKLIKYDALK